MNFTYDEEAVFTRDVELHQDRAEKCLFLIVLAMQAELRRQIEATAVGGLVCTQRFLEVGFLPETKKHRVSALRDGSRCARAQALSRDQLNTVQQRQTRGTLAAGEYFIKVFWVFDHDYSIPLTTSSRSRVRTPCALSTRAWSSVLQ